MPCCHLLTEHVMMGCTFKHAFYFIQTGLAEQFNGCRMISLSLMHLLQYYSFSSFNKSLNIGISVLFVPPGMSGWKKGESQAWLEGGVLESWGSGLARSTGDAGGEETWDLTCAL